MKNNELNLERDTVFTFLKGIVFNQKNDVSNRLVKVENIIQFENQYSSELKDLKSREIENFIKKYEQGLYKDKFMNGSAEIFENLVDYLYLHNSFKTDDNFSAEYKAPLFPGESGRKRRGNNSLEFTRSENAAALLHKL